MNLYRKKPVIIEAEQWDGSATEAVSIIDWMSRGGADAVRYHDAVRHFVPAHIAIPTLEGTMYAHAGDWIIRGIQGEFYPCKPDIFDATYDKIGDERR